MNEKQDFKITLSETDLLLKPLEALAEFIDEVRVKITKEHLEIRELDPANVCLMDYKLYNHSCTEYEVTEEIKFGINLKNLMDILKIATKEDVITLYANINEGMLRLELNARDNKKEVTINFLDLDLKEEKMPELNFDSSFGVNNKSIKKIITDFKKISDSCVLIKSDQEIRPTITAESNTTKIKTNIDLDKNDPDYFYQTKDNVKSKYSIEYLDKIFKHLYKIKETSRFNFSTDYPVQIMLVNDKLSLMFVLAPRVIED